jgi:large subunit ribosomal protein L29
MELKEIREMNDGELASREQLLKKEVYDLRQQSRLGQASKPARFKTIRKEIAQIMTVINERKIQHGNKK